MVMILKRRYRERKPTLLLIIILFTIFVGLSSLQIGRNTDNECSTSLDNKTKMNCALPSFFSSSNSDSVPDLSSFAYNLFSEISASEEKGDVVVSPFSVASALSLILVGATPKSACQAELQSVLSINTHTQIPMLSEKILKHSTTDANNDNDGVQLTSANGIWISRSIKESYVENVQNVHKGKASLLPHTYDPINAFISDKTDGMINNMLEGEMDANTVSILINAVYFKGSWKEKFDPILTRSGVFTTAVGVQRDAMFMNDTRKVQVAINVKEFGGASVISLEYGKKDDTEFTALFFLPQENTNDSLSKVFSSIAKLSKSKSGNSLKEVLEEQMKETKVKLSLPRFRIEYGTKSLKTQLMNMGIKAAFDGRNVFSELSDDPEVYLSDVLHKAVMEVTEEGTVATAATAGMMLTRSAPIPPLEIVFDRPFGMIILHIPSMTPLFVAKIEDPELNI